MSFIEVESWEIAPGRETEHHEAIRKWFDYVRTHHGEMFAEWKSARYFRQVDRDGRPTGRYIMLFEFHTVEGHHAYKERRKDWSGPYAEYKTVDPYELFNHASVRMEYWEPREVDRWFEFP
jgi:hypothetical protein